MPPRFFLVLPLFELILVKNYSGDVGMYKCASKVNNQFRPIHLIFLPGHCHQKDQMSPVQVIAFENLVDRILCSIIYASLFVVVILDGILIIIWIVLCSVVTTITLLCQEWILKQWERNSYATLLAPDSISSLGLFQTVSLLFQLDFQIFTCMLGPEIIMLLPGSNYQGLSQKIYSHVLPNQNFPMSFFQSK